MAKDGFDMLTTCGCHIPEVQLDRNEMETENIISTNMETKMKSIEVTLESMGGNGLHLQY
jgi:hypothetical protein